MMNIDEHGQGHAEGFQIGLALTFLRALSRERENYHKIHHSTRLVDLKIRCGAKDFRYGTKSRLERCGTIKEG